MGMKKEATLLVLTLIIIISVAEANNKATEWAKSVAGEKETTTTLQFYFHDTVSGNSPSAIRVAQASTSLRSPTAFGAVMIADDPLTEGPKPSSKLVGRAQGLYAAAGQKELALIMAMGYCFTDGVYNGSCLSILSRNPASNPARELAVVGGTGVFRMARGYALLETKSLNNAGDAVVGYNVTVVHTS